MARDDLIYIAGLFDGEGSISLFWEKRPNLLRTRVCRGTISIGNNDLAVLQYVKACLGGCVYHYPRRRPQWKEHNVWRASTKEAVDIINALLPYLRIKRKQAKLLIEYQQYKESIPWRGRKGYTQEEWDTIKSYLDKMRSLNANSGNKVNHSLVDPTQ